MTSAWCSSRSKRMLDIILVTPALVMTAPLMLLIALGIRGTSPGPVLFRQWRWGLNERQFQLLKFRTMENLRAESGPGVTRSGDPRVTRLGKWLRRWKLDELPQFINVLWGDMSVVGPRPHLPQHDDAFVRLMRKYVIRRFIRPGLTGWAQVNGFRGQIHTEGDVQRRVEADIHYLENWSFSLDCLIILKTIKHCILPPRTAY